MGFMAGIQKYGIAFTCVIIVFYSAFCIFTGTRGLPRYFFLQQELKTARSVDDNYIKQKEKLQDRVRNFSSESLDLDLLEERARLVLNYVEKDEFVIIDAE